MLLNALDKCDKVVNERPDHIVQHNVTVQMVENQTAIFQEAIRETMAEVDPEIAFLFMEKLSLKMKNLQEPSPLNSLNNNKDQNKQLKEAQILNTSITDKMEE